MILQYLLIKEWDLCKDTKQPLTKASLQGTPMQETFPWRIIQELCCNILPCQLPPRQLPFTFLSQTLFTHERRSPAGPTPSGNVPVEVTWVYGLVLLTVEFQGVKGCRKQLSQNIFFTRRINRPKNYPAHNIPLWFHTESHILDPSDWHRTLFKTPNISSFFISTVELCYPTSVSSAPIDRKEINQNLAPPFTNAHGCAEGAGVFVRRYFALMTTRIVPVNPC